MPKAKVLFPMFIRTEQNLCWSFCPHYKRVRESPKNNTKKDPRSRQRNYKQRLKEMSAVNLENGRLGEMGITSLIHEALLQRETEKLFSMPTEDRSRSHWLKLAWIAGRRFNLDMKSDYLVLRFVKSTCTNYLGRPGILAAGSFQSQIESQIISGSGLFCDGWDDLGMDQTVFWSLCIL